MLVLTKPFDWISPDDTTEWHRADNNILSQANIFFLYHVLSQWQMLEQGRWRKNLQKRWFRQELLASTSLQSLLKTSASWNPLSPPRCILKVYILAPKTSQWNFLVLSRIDAFKYLSGHLPKTFLTKQWPSEFLLVNECIPKQPCKHIRWPSCRRDKIPQDFGNNSTIVSPWARNIAPFVSLLWFLLRWRQVQPSSKLHWLKTMRDECFLSFN